MKFERLCGAATAASLLLIWAIVAWLGFAGPIWRATWSATNGEWLGFAGAVAGALATIAAGAAALFAAYKTLKPITAQLDQIIKQNDFVLHDRLRARATDLNQEMILVEQINATCRPLEHALDEFFRERSPRRSEDINSLQQQVLRFSQFVTELQARRGNVWGSPATQAERMTFINLAMMTDAIGATLVLEAKKMSHLAPVVLKTSQADWKRRSSQLIPAGDVLFGHLTREVEKISRAISDVEHRLFGD